MFNLHAWVCVSQEWKTRDLLERLIKSFKKRLSKEELEMLEKMKDYDMELYLRELLEGCRYLVVIDDVWHKEAWESLKRALPDNKNRSRIIITTRKEDVVELSDHRTYVHKLRFLRPDESWKLFCKKAFPENNGACPQEMKKLGEEMMAKCGGLPLAIIVLGGLLSRKQFHEWHMVKERIWRELKDDSIYISSLLDLSYKDLPYELKSCFLYLGLFPEDFTINVEQLIKLWIAEEFIPLGEEERDLEEMAENYLKELISRSLIQVVARNWRMVSKCRVHDLLRDLAVNKAKKLNFLHILDKSIINSAPTTVASSYRRIAFGSRFESFMSFDHSHQRVRTVSLLKYSDSSGFDAKMMMPALICTRFSLLRVLNLEGVDVTGEAKWRFDEAVGKLIHLRYLGLNKIGIADLPECIENLQALQTLDVSDYNRGRTILPRGISKLKQLRHLIGDLESPHGTLLLFEELTNLQTLKTVIIPGEGTRNNIHAFAKLHNPKYLSVRSDAEYLLSVQPLLLHCRHLIELKIAGGIQYLPKQMNNFLPNLKYLTLSNSRLEEDPIPALEMLPNLLVLELLGVGVNIMTFTATGFPQLQVLTLSRLQTQFRMGEGAMPRLKALTTDNATQKRILSERLRSLPDVKVLNWEWENFF